MRSNACPSLRLAQTPERWAPFIIWGQLSKIKMAMDEHETRLPLEEPLLGDTKSQCSSDLLLLREQYDVAKPTRGPYRDQPERHKCTDSGDTQELDLIVQLFGRSYARTCTFWRKAAAAVMIGFLTGFATAAFFVSFRILSPSLLKFGPNQSQEGKSAVTSIGKHRSKRD